MSQSKDTLTPRVLMGPSSGACLVIIRACRGQEDRLCRRVGDVLRLLGDGGAELGLSFVNDKAQLLLPKDWDTPEVVPLV